MMHMERPDFVTVKAAVKQMQARLEVEADAADQWASLLRNRGMTEAAVVARGASQALTDAVGRLRKVHELLIVEQEKPEKHHSDD